MADKKVEDARKKVKSLIGKALKERQLFMKFNYLDGIKTELEKRGLLSGLMIERIKSAKSDIGRYLGLQMICEEIRLKKS